MEGKKIYLKATKYLIGDAFESSTINEIFSNAEDYNMYSERNSENQVFIKEEQVNTGLSGKRYAVYNNSSCRECDLIAKISSKDNKGGEKETKDSVEITYASIEELGTMKNCVCYIVGKSGKALILEVDVLLYIPHHEVSVYLQAWYLRSLHC